jgi:hypothetical protein
LIEMPLIEFNHIQSTSTTARIFWRNTKQPFFLFPFPIHAGRN